MANQEHVEILKQSKRHWDQWRTKNPLLNPDLRQLEISHAGFDGRQLEYCDFTASEFRNVSFHFADLSFSDFNHVTLENVDISEADLHCAKFHHTGFFNVNFSHVTLYKTEFYDVDLRTVAGLESASHVAHSYIDLDTIYQSKGQIPESFLRGCGVPEDFIKLIPSLTAQPFEFYKCFISHSSLDLDFCKRLHADLQNEGVRVWFFPEDARTGRGVWDEIDRSIKIYDKLMVVCSENSLNSGPVLREIERALQREDREHKHILFPIKIDDYLFEEWDHPRKADVLDKVVGDFTRWKDHDSYQKALDRLLRDLKAGEE